MDDIGDRATDGHRRDGVFSPNAVLEVACLADTNIEGDG